MNRLIKEDGHVICYVNGTCLNEGTANASAGFAVVFNIDHPWNSFDGVVGDPTDYVAKAQGVRRAYDIARRNCIIDLQIRSDVRLGRSEENNIRHFQEIVKALPRDPTLKIAFEPERGPNDGIFNLSADRLAKDGTAIYRDRNSLL